MTIKLLLSLSAWKLNRWHHSAFSNVQQFDHWNATTCHWFGYSHLSLTSLSIVVKPKMDNMCIFVVWTWDCDWLLVVQISIEEGVGEGGKTSRDVIVEVLEWLEGGLGEGYWWQGEGCRGSVEGWGRVAMTRGRVESSRATNIVVCRVGSGCRRR